MSYVHYWRRDRGNDLLSWSEVKCDKTCYNLTVCVACPSAAGRGLTECVCHR